MSVTTTDNSIVDTTIFYLNDYELQHSTGNKPSPAETNRDTSHAQQPRDCPEITVAFLTTDRLTTTWIKVCDRLVQTWSNGRLSE
ncbi:hypothetical protein BDV09DRAFT_181348 [Aspergillus tetrazonus]